MNDPRARDGEPALDDVRAMFPQWEVWTGIAGLVYARRLLSSPPMVVRAEDPRDLIDQINAEIGRRSR
jgi:hypothetical protein